MNATPTAAEPSESDFGRLLYVAERYLAAVELFRAEGCEPRWVPTVGDLRKSATR